MWRLTCFAWCFGLLVFLGSMAASAAPAVSKYNLCILVVDFSDDTATPLDFTLFDEKWVEPLKAYFADQSNGQLAFNVTVVPTVIRLASRTLYATRSADGSFGCTAGTGCRAMWLGADSPIHLARMAGHIEQALAGFRPVGGSNADVFDGFLFVSALGVDSHLPGVALNDQVPSGTSGRRRVTRAYDMGHCAMDRAEFPNPPNGVFNDPPLLPDWETAAHEVGHMMGPDHPAAYINGWELMDSCYPCASGIFMRGERDVIQGTFGASFEGWIPAERIVTFDPPVGGTVVVDAIELDPDTVTSAMGLQVRTNNGYSFFVESRRFLGADDFLDELNGNSRVEGVMILKATPGGRTSNGSSMETVVQRAPGVTERDRWISTFRPGQTFVDVASDLSIVVGPSVGTGFTVTVNYGGASAAAKPDIGMIPWQTPPMNSWETVDIWVDSPCNGYEIERPGDPRALRYGRRLDGTVIGNGDDPCANEINLVYAKIRNFGTKMAQDVVVRFDVTDPPGVGIRGDTGWIEFDTVDQVEFPELASIPPGESVTVYARWRPEYPALGDARVPYHSCLRVRCDAVSEEVALTNQDGNAEQENVGWYEVRRPDLSSGYEIAERALSLFNSSNETADYTLGYEIDLPDGWDVEVGDDRFKYTVAAASEERIPVRISVPDDTPIGQSFFIYARAFAMHEAVDPLGQFLEFNAEEVSGVLIAAQTVLKSQITITQVSSQPGPYLFVKGNLGPGLGDELVAIRYEGPGEQGSIETVVTNEAGDFEHLNLKSTVGDWRIRAIYAGSLSHSSAESPVVDYELTAGGEGEGEAQGEGEGETVGEGGAEGEAEAQGEGEAEGEGEAQGEGECETVTPGGCPGCNSSNGAPGKSVGDWVAALLGLGILLVTHLHLKRRSVHA